MYHATQFKVQLWQKIMSFRRAPVYLTSVSCLPWYKSPQVSEDMSEEIQSVETSMP